MTAHRIRITQLLVAAALAFGVTAATRGDDVRVDLLVYGATPAGIAAALAAGDDGASVVLMEPTPRLGGLVTCGLSHTDFRTFEGLNGAFLDFSRRVESFYRSTYGDKSPQAAECWRGTQAEPKVNLHVFEAMLTERRNVQVLTGLRLTSAEVRTLAEGRRQIARVRFASSSGNQRQFAPRMLIDATYEGDLMAAAGVKHRIGREARSEYGESLAPDQPDEQVQGYNFRFIATRDPSNRAPVRQPAGYRRDDYTGLLPLLENGRIKTIFGYPGQCLYKAHLPRLPNGKYDINDVSNGTVRLSLPGENYAWPAADEALRRRLFDDHLRWNAGLLWFVQNDSAVPAKFRDEAREWGWCRDEFTDTDHLPPQLYVREARRMVGRRVFTERDTDHAPGDARAVLHRDAIAMGDYGPNCHGTAHEGSRFGGKHRGEFYKPVSPYQIPYGTLLPHDVVNLLVPGAASASHVGFCALRLEPIWMSLGQAAGHAAHLAIADRLVVQDVPVARLQRRLHAAGAATIYVSDVPPGHVNFANVQWWGTAGGFHGLSPMPQKPGQRGKNIEGQYYEAFPNHAAELDRPLDSATHGRWLGLVQDLGLPVPTLPPANGRTTRRDFINAAAKLAE